jgi:hypothetical protein
LAFRARRLVRFLEARKPDDDIANMCGVDLSRNAPKRPGFADRGIRYQDSGAMMRRVSESLLPSVGRIVRPVDRHCCAPGTRT